MGRVLPLLLALTLGAGCAGPGPALKSQSGPSLPMTAEALKGSWKGSWFADGGSVGGFELRIDEVKGDLASGTGAWHDTVVGTAPFRFEGKLAENELRVEFSRDYWFRLRLYRPRSEHAELAGRYSTVGRGVVFTGEILLSR
ncbi:MAG: hypothetical protein AABZ20_08690 [candidate division NC10 bacterium]